MFDEEERKTIVIDNKELISENNQEVETKTEENTITNTELDQETTAAAILTQMVKDKIETEVKAENFGTMYEQIFGTALKKEEEKEEVETNNANDIISENITLFEESEEYNKIPYKFIGIAFKTYIIFELDNELYILDQHAAHERILY